jgi:serine/threonine protein kinase
VTPERERTIERICLEALERPLDERARFVSDACGGDDGLRRDVERLLAHDGDASAFLETPALGVAAQMPGVGEPVLTPGQTVGAYTIVAPLGAGGMGEVYRARDTTLGRDVAIKVLSSAFTGDPGRLARLERESRALAALNHPNIATIYGVEQIGGLHALVLEIIEGSTLGQLIAGRPLAFKKVQPIAHQIAAALEAAHERGIVHRDLKPANVMIRADGVVKVLDFGLAKMFAPGVADSSKAPGLATGGTAVGIVVGTPAYMSPEQALGAEVDHRTDIWAFGCVIYELLTGRVAFAGHTSPDTITAVLSREPDWTAIPPTTPPDVTRVLQRCLRKDVDRRLHDVADARIEIDEAHDIAVTPVGGAPGRARAFWPVLALALAAGGAYGVWSWRQTAAPSDEVRLELTTPATRAPASLAISPDGHTLAFVANAGNRSKLWVRSLDSPSARALDGTDHATLPFWSPDSRSIGFGSQSQLKRIDLDSGIVRVLAASPLVYGGSWNQNGVILFNRGNGSRLWRVAADGGEPVHQDQLDSLNRFHLTPQFLPDGLGYLFHVAGPAQGVYAGRLDAPPQPRRIVEAQAGAYAAGHLFFVRDGRLFAQPFDAAAVQLRGSPTAIAEGVMVDQQGVAALSVSAAGTIVYRTGPANAATHFTWFDRNGNALDTVPGSNIGSGFHSSLSSDGRLAFSRAADKAQDLWILDATRGVSSRFTSDPGFELSPQWSPDASRVAFLRETPGGFEQVIRVVDRTERDQILFEGRPCWPTDWSHDGRLVLCSVGPAIAGDILAVPVDQTQPPIPVVEGTFREWNGVFSPDDRWVAYQSDASGASEVYIQPFRRAGRRVQVSSTGGVQPQWRRDGKELYFLTPDYRLMAVPIGADGPDDLKVGVPEALFQTPLTGGIVDGRHYHVSADGQRFLLDVRQESNSPINIILNWRPESARAGQR